MGSRPLHFNSIKPNLFPTYISQWGSESDTFYYNDMLKGCSGRGSASCLVVVPRESDSQRRGILGSIVESVQQRSCRSALAFPTHHSSGTSIGLGFSSKNKRSSAAHSASQREVRRRRRTSTEFRWPAFDNLLAAQAWNDVCSSIPPV